MDAWLATQGYVVASIDTRGTGEIEPDFYIGPNFALGRRGLDFLQQTYRQLGLMEIADIRTGAKELAKLLDCVNSDRVAIWVLLHIHK